MLTRTGRLVGLSALGVGLAITAAACSTDDDGTTAPTRLGSRVHRAAGKAPGSYVHAA